MNNINKDPSGLVQLSLSIILTILSGLTVMWLWEWYIVPIGLPAINLAHAIGLDTFVSFITTTQIVDPKSKPYWERTTYSFMFAIMSLILGWALHFAI